MVTVYELERTGGVHRLHTPRSLSRKAEHPVSVLSRSCSLLYIKYADVCNFKFR